ncbi:LANO_0B08548g1_1 [Lachancea nothofagi CBS 11611]|uniref:LANO_0B08548g1_1 n=1 Tax=Lachancea nothofagi CBS 11611 TaxID=1266666 RepID=A0A1G4J0S2_9SACH|nr:LANO_0B08548g1_1 [Lachancea nothofagi CBS 11611]
MTSLSESDQQDCKAKKDVEISNHSAAPYSRFGTSEKYFLVIVCASCGIFSSIAARIYYPALNVIQEEFNVSQELLNISLVVYFIFQAITPSVIGGFADSWGRRPVILWSLAIYVAACIGLARSSTYGQILGLRCLQSAGISPVIAINSGLLGDVTQRHERGGFIGIGSGIQLIGSAFGAVIGAGIISRWDWRAVFWFLAIGSGVSLTTSVFLMPETNRTIVGNGSIIPRNPLNRAPILLLPAVKKRMHINNPDLESLAPSKKLDFSGPFKILATPSVIVVLCVASMQFAIYQCQLTVLSSIVQDNYDLSIAQVGLCYLPSGICSLISVVTSGRVLNWNYKRRFAQHQLKLQTLKKELLETYGGDVKIVEEMLKTERQYKFNIYRTRLEVGFFPMILSFAGYIAFAWCIDVRTKLAAVLFCSGFASLFSNSIVSCTSTLLVDLYPEKSSSATACLNLFRCSFAAIFVAALSSMEKKMSVGGTFTFMVAIAFLFAVIMVFVVGSKLAKDTAEESFE